MTEKPTNGDRTHEPNLREVVSELDGLRDLAFSKLTALRELIDERDRLYSTVAAGQKTAVDAALLAQEKLVSAAFLASEKAIVKAEDAQREYNARSNEFRGQLDDQAKTLLSRVEATTEFKSRDDKIEQINRDIRDLRESRSAGQGGKEAGIDMRGTLIALGGLAIAAIVLIMKATGHA